MLEDSTHSTKNTYDSTSNRYVFVQLLFGAMALILTIMTWFFFVEDKYVLCVNRMIVSTDSFKVQSGDILRVGVTVDGSVAAHWIETPLHHYVIVLQITSTTSDTTSDTSNPDQLWVAHTWYKPLSKNNNIHIPPSYQLQPLEDFRNSSHMVVYEVFRNNSIQLKSFTMETVQAVLKSFKSSVRCYITIMNLYQCLYPEVQIYYSYLMNTTLRNYWLVSFLLYKPSWYEKAIKSSGFVRHGIYKFVNMINEPSNYTTLSSSYCACRV